VAYSESNFQYVMATIPWIQIRRP